MTTDWVPHPTADGSFTFFSEEFSEAFHSRQGAKTEAFQKFAHVTHLAMRATQPSVRLLDVCYGLGYNTAAALEVIWTTNPGCRVEWAGLELDASVPLAAIAPSFLESWSTPVQAALQTIAHQHHQHTSTLQAQLLIGDARQTIQALAQTGFQADAIFFDPFHLSAVPNSGRWSFLPGWYGVWLPQAFWQPTRAPPQCEQQCKSLDSKLAPFP